MYLEGHNCPIKVWNKGLKGIKTNKKYGIPWNKGKSWSDEIKKRISGNRKGKCLGDKNPSKREDVRNKIREKRIGVAHPFLFTKNPAKRPEVRNKISEKVIEWIKKHPENHALSKISKNKNEMRKTTELPTHNFLKSMGFKIDKDYFFNHNVGTYWLDFAFPKLKIAIECDGTYFHKFRKAKLRDERKNKWLNEHGWHLVRLTEDETENDNFCKLSFLETLRFLDALQLLEGA